MANTLTIYLMVITTLIINYVCVWASSDTTTAGKIDLSELTFERIAVMPFLIGKLESPDKPVEKPLSQPLPQLLADNYNVKEKSGQVMTRLVDETLRARFRDKVVPAETVTEAFLDISSDHTIDTPRKLAMKLGDVIGADLVVVGTLWRFREKGTDAQPPEGSASIAFAVFLVDVPTGKRLWRGAFDGTQKALTEDVVGGLKAIKMGIRWLSADELARYGVKQVFRKFPLH
ncbi:MAG: hypothetical protein JSU83_13235 [Deltaproteobacteria bacterium]|nr:MAG: hypothetical protein JSU83_13235 [Deltaproteobacteria bacterium]